MPCASRASKRLACVFFFAVALSGQSPEPTTGTGCVEKLEIPRYPRLASAARIEGTIRASVLLTETGSVRDIKIESESKYRQARSLFGAPVEDAIRHATFRTGCSSTAVSFAFHFVLSTGGKTATVFHGNPNVFWIVAEAMMVQP